MMRVAAVHLATRSSSSSEMLTRCLPLIDVAVAQKAQLVVLPAVDGDSCGSEDHPTWDQALTVDGPLLGAIAEKARINRCFLVVAATLRQDYPYVIHSTLLFGPEGSCLMVSDTHAVADCYQGAYASPRHPPRVRDVDCVRLGLLSGKDGSSFECPRVLALQDAQLLCHSSSSTDSATNPDQLVVRAAENRVFVIHAATLRSQPYAAPDSPDAPQAELVVSQIIAPDGRLLAWASGLHDEVIWADIDPSAADDKLRLDGSDVFFNRRPTLYGEILQPPIDAQQSSVNHSLLTNETLDFALVSIDEQENAQRLQQALDKLSQLPNNVQLAVLPELFWSADVNFYPLTDIQEYAKQVEMALLQLCRLRQIYVCTSLIFNSEQGLQHCGVLLGPEGVEICQPQLHFAARFGWHQIGARLVTADLPWGRVAIFIGDDFWYPELVKVAALRGVQTLLVPFDCQEAWESQLGVVNRAMENNLCVIACSRDTENSGGLIACADNDWALVTSESGFVRLWQGAAIARHREGTLMARLQGTHDPLALGVAGATGKAGAQPQSCWFLAYELCKPKPSRVDAFEGWGMRPM